ncbi:MAG TPA: YceI family protein [Candidatus Acidoferrales bacterium]
MDPQLRFVLDSHASQFTAHAFASGLAAVVAHNPKFSVQDFSGEALFTGASLSRAKLKLTLKAASLKLMDEVSEYDYGEIRRVTQEEVLEEQRFPEIHFESSEITATKISDNLYTAHIAGSLTLHGRSHPQKIDCQVVVGDDSLRAIGHFNIRQTDFGIHIASIARNTLKMKDEVKIAFFIIGRRAVA